jgi:hypothetical protein
VADAMYEIRDRKLYRAKYKRFSDYCESVHRMSRQYANRLIKAGKIRAEMVPIVSKMGLPEPENEAQLRELGRLNDVQSRVDAYSEAAEEARTNKAKITAKDIAKVIERHRESEQPDPGKSPTPTRRLADARKILDGLEDALQAGEDIKPLVRRLRDTLGEEP